MTLKQWLYALLESVLNGVAIAGIAYLTVLPQTASDFLVSLKKLVWVGLGGAILGLFNYLRQSPISKITLGLFLVTSILFLPLTACAFGPNVVKSTLAWDAPTTNIDGSPLTDLSGYFVYWKTGSGVYGDANRRDVGNVISFNLGGLSLSVAVYQFVVCTYDTEGNESSPSNEAEWDTILPSSATNNKVQ